MKKNLIISTTSTLQGFEIVEYEGYIEASSTIGSGFLTDVASSWTDAFGKKSTMIENKLQIIKKEVIEKLESKAIKKHCNAIVGLRVDVDEISSNQRMIFMVTAVGTAVKCVKTDTSDSSLQLSGDFLKMKIITSHEYEEKLTSLQTTIQQGNVNAYQEYKQMEEQIIEEQLFEFIEVPFMECLLTVAFKQPLNNVLDEETKEVLDGFPTEKLAHAFLEIMLKCASSAQSILAFRKLENYQPLCHYFSSQIPLSILYEYLSKENDYFIVIILYPLLHTFKSYYNKDDIKMVEQIIIKLKERYWSDHIQSEHLVDTDRICECGAILTQHKSCSCNAKKSISASTFKDKKALLEHFTILHRELLQFFKQ